LPLTCPFAVSVLLLITVKVVSGADGLPTVPTVKPLPLTTSISLLPVPQVMAVVQAANVDPADVPKRSSLPSRFPRF